MLGWRDSVNNLTEHTIHSMWRIWDVYFLIITVKLKVFLKVHEVELLTVGGRQWDGLLLS